MRLRKPCEHDRYEPHTWVPGMWERTVVDCPGGEFLPEDAASRLHSVIRIWNPDLNDWAVQLCAKDLMAALAADQVGEPG